MAEIAAAVPAALAESAEHDLDGYANVFAARAKAAGEDSATKSEWMVLWGVCFLSLHASRRSSDGPQILMSDGRKDPKDLADSEVELLRDVLRETKDDELHARLGDVLWLARRDHVAARSAIERYLAAAEAACDPESWVDGAARLERALVIARSLRDSAMTDRVVDHMEGWIRRLDGADPSFLSVHLHETLIEARRGDATALAPLAEKAARNASKPGDWRRAGLAWRAVARWKARIGDKEGERNADLDAARTHIGEADDALRRDPPSHGVAAAFIEDAILALRPLGAPRDELDALRKRLAEHQAKMMDEMVAIQVDFEPGERIEKVLTWVDQPSFEEALMRLALVGSWPDRDQLVKLAKSTREASVLASLFPSRRVGPRGNTIAPPRDAVGNSPEFTTEELFAALNMYEQDHGAVSVLPAFRRINERHRPTDADLLPYLVGNPLVPKGREGAHARALVIAFRGEHVDAATLLLPQFEEALRSLLRSRGVLTVGLDARGVQNEIDLSAVLAHRELAAIFDDDLLFQLRALLVERNGRNLRNELAHGLADESTVTVASAYYVWLHLVLILWPFLTRKGA